MTERLLTDEQFDARVVDELRRRHGHDVVTVRQTCSSKYGDAFDDKSVLEYALSERRVVITDNQKHFRKLHVDMPWHSGIVNCSVYANPNKKADRINDILRRTAARIGMPHFTGQLMSIPSESAEMPDVDTDIA
jgi:uncharacterized protein DUF5615